MLREVRSPFLHPRIDGTRVTTAATVVTVQDGEGNYALTSAGAGVLTGTPERMWSRAPIVVASPSSLNIAAGGYVVSGTTPGGNIAMFGPTGVADDGTAHCIVLGYDSRNGNRYMRRSNGVRCQQAQGILLAFNVTTGRTPCININNYNATVTDDGTGAVTIHLRRAFTHAGCVAVATPVSATCQRAMIGTVTSDTIQVSLYDIDAQGGATAGDGTFNLIILGEGCARHERTMSPPLYNDQRKPVLFAYPILYTNGVPSFNFNDGDAVITDTGVGQVTITFNEAFARVPIMVAMMVSNAAAVTCTINASTTGGAFEVDSWDAAAALADPTSTFGLHILGIGWDDLCEY